MIEKKYILVFILGLNKNEHKIIKQIIKNHEITAIELHLGLEDIIKHLFSLRQKTNNQQEMENFVNEYYSRGLKQFNLRSLQIDKNSCTVDLKENHTNTNYSHVLETNLKITLRFYDENDYKKLLGQVLFDLLIILNLTVMALYNTILEKRTNLLSEKQYTNQEINNAKKAITYKLRDAFFKENTVLKTKRQYMPVTRDQFNKKNEFEYLNIRPEKDIIQLRAIPDNSTLLFQDFFTDKIIIEEIDSDEEIDNEQTNENQEINNEQKDEKLKEINNEQTNENQEINNEQKDEKQEINNDIRKENLPEIKKINE